MVPKYSTWVNIYLVTVHNWLSMPLPWLTCHLESPWQISALHAWFLPSSGLPGPAEWCWVRARFSRLRNGERSPEWPVCLTKCFFLPFFFLFFSCSPGLFTAPQLPTLSHSSSLLSLILDHMGDVPGRLGCTCAGAFCLWLNCRKLNLQVFPKRQNVAFSVSDSCFYICEPDSKRLLWILH